MDYSNEYKKIIHNLKVFIPKLIEYSEGPECFDENEGEW